MLESIGHSDFSLKQLPFYYLKIPCLICAWLTSFSVSLVGCICSNYNCNYLRKQIKQLICTLLIRLTLYWIYWFIYLTRAAKELLQSLTSAVEHGEALTLLTFMVQEGTLMLPEQKCNHQYHPSANLVISNILL